MQMPTRTKQENQERVEFLVDELKISQAKAIAYNSAFNKLALVPTELFSEFLMFRDDFVEPMKSNDLINAEAIRAFFCKFILTQIQAGAFKFSTLSEMVQFINEHFKNKRFCYGVADYLECVIFGLDDKCNILNYYAINEFGRPKMVDSSEMAEIYNWLFANQNRIGVIEYFSKDQVRQIMAKHDERAKQTLEQIKTCDSDEPLVINPKALELIKNAYKRA